MSGACGVSANQVILVVFLKSLLSKFNLASIDTIFPLAFLQENTNDKTKALND